ncbi:MAG: hypothetical protein ACC628_12440 [Pirellulaceae bacterium]
MTVSFQQVSHNTDGTVSSITIPDPDGTGPLSAAVTSFSYDTKDRLTTITYPDTKTRTFTYDSADNVLTESDELSEVTTLTYDKLDWLTKVTDREAAETEFAYNAMGLLTKVTDALDNATDYTYNSRSWLTKIEQPDPDGASALGPELADEIQDPLGMFRCEIVTIGGVLWKPDICKGKLQQADSIPIADRRPRD